MLRLSSPISSIDEVEYFIHSWYKLIAISSSYFCSFSACSFMTWRVSYATAFHISIWFHTVCFYVNSFIHFSLFSSSSFSFVLSSSNPWILAICSHDLCSIFFFFSAHSYCILSISAHNVCISPFTLTQLASHFSIYWIYASILAFNSAFFRTNCYSRWLILSLIWPACTTLSVTMAMLSFSLSICWLLLQIINSSWSIRLSRNIQ